MRKIITGLAACTIITGCAVTPVYKAQARHDDQNYVLELEEQQSGLSMTAIIKANGSEVFKHTYKNLFNEPSCYKTAVASWHCDFYSELDGKKLKIEYVTKANFAQATTLYNLYLDGDFLTQIVTTSK